MVLVQSAILVISCSDARLTVDEAGESWREQLGFNGPVFEVRLPGGGLVLAEPDGVFAASVFESLEILSQATRIGTVVLACHEDCAYFRLRYSPQGGSPIAEERAQRRTIASAVQVLEQAAPGVMIETVYQRLLQPTRQPRPTRAQAPSPAYAAPTRQPAHVVPLKDEPIERPDPLGTNGQRMTARQLQSALYEQALNEPVQAEDSYRDATSEAVKGNGVPAWRVERRTREFLEWMRDQGGVNSTIELQRLGLGFISSYGQQKLPRTTARDVMDEARPSLEQGRKRSFLRWKKS
jgi:hypothetical protein